MGLLWSWDGATLALGMVLQWGWDGVLWGWDGVTTAFIAKGTGG